MAAARLVFRTFGGECWLDSQGPFVGQVEIDDPSPDLVRLASHAHAAGVVEVTEGLDLSTVQSQEDGEAAYAEAQGEHVVERNDDGSSRSYWTGPWQEGQNLQAALEAEARDRGELGATVDVQEIGPDDVATISLGEAPD